MELSIKSRLEKEAEILAKANFEDIASEEEWEAVEVWPTF